MHLRFPRFLPSLGWLASLSPFIAAMGLLLYASQVYAQKPQIVWSDQEKPILQQIRSLRSLSDDVRARTTKQLALDIRRLPPAPNKLRLAVSLANLSTEGDFGRDALQEVTTTLADSLREQPLPDENGQPAYPYVELAKLVRYEHMQASLQASPLAAAMAKLDADDKKREQADFTLHDLRGQAWTLKDQRGKVILVNFWATWCPPCRKEMPDLQSLYEKYKEQGFVVLAISDEEIAKVKPFIAGEDIKYPILLDPGRQVAQLYNVDGLPQSFVYDRNGKLVAHSIDMRTKKQFQQMLALADLK